MTNNIIWHTGVPENLLDEKKMSHGNGKGWPRFLVTLSNESKNSYKIYTATRMLDCPYWYEVQIGDEREYKPKEWQWHVDSYDWHDNERVIAWAELPSPFEEN